MTPDGENTTLFLDFEKPPPPEPFDPVASAPFIVFEAERQLSLFRPVYTGKTDSRVLGCYIEGITNALKRGIAKIKLPEGDILFWNPIEKDWVVYDQEYNKLMLAFAQNFKEKMTRLHEFGKGGF